MFLVNDHEPATVNVPRPRFRCERCNGRGWLASPIPNEWPHVCPICKGRALFTPHTLGVLVGEDGGTIARLDAGRVRPKTASRLLPKLVDLARP